MDKVKQEIIQEVLRILAIDSSVDNIGNTLTDLGKFGNVMYETDIVDINASEAYYIYYFTDLNLYLKIEQYVNSYENYAYYEEGCQIYFVDKKVKEIFVYN